MWVYLHLASRLPSAYQEVEWIESSWTQWIDTWLYANQDTVVETKWNLVQYNSNVSYDKFYWTYWSNWSNCFFLQSNRPENYKIRTVNYSNNSSIRKIDSLSAITTGTDYTVKHSATEFWLNWVLQWSCSTISYTSPSTITIFAIHDWSSVTQNVYLKLYYFKMYSWVTLVRDFVPCYRKSDGVIWMYDLVNNTFNTNQWSWVFTKWPDISWRELKNAYIGEYQEGWQPWVNTLCYYPFDTDYSDQSWNGYNLTNRWATTIWTKWGVDCAVFIKDNNSWLYTTSIPFNTISTSMTFNFWMYVDQFNTWENNVFWMWTASAGSCIILWYLQPINIWHRWYNDIATSTNSTLSTWQNIVVTQDSSWTKIYLDWNQIGSSSYYATLSGNEFNVWYFNWSSALNRKYIGWMSNLILESKTWTAQEVVDYYNQTKSLYGIS